MLPIERVHNLFLRKPVDRIAVYEHIWGATQERWANEGLPGDVSIEDYFEYDCAEQWPFNMVADLDFESIVVSETDETIATLDGNGATLRRHKLHESTPEHVGYTIKEAADYYGNVRHLLIPDERRINFEGYRTAKQAAKEKNRFFFWAGCNAFEYMHPLVGHENMLVGMALEPEWIAEMAMDYARLIVDLMEILFAKEGPPDGVWFYEDMGFKQKPFMSPAMYKELLMPAHKYTIDYCKSKKLPVLMHSCGYVEPFVPFLIEAGVQCLQVIEVKAGMDLLKLYKNYGDRLSFMGGIDVRVLYTNDIAQIEQELVSKIPVVKQGCGYALHSDHSIPNTVSFDAYKYFVERGRELGSGSVPLHPSCPCVAANVPTECRYTLHSPV